jgi:hypothetical protein
MPPARGWLAGGTGDRGTGGGRRGGGRRGGGVGQHRVAQYAGARVPQVRRPRAGWAGSGGRGSCAGRGCRGWGCGAGRGGVEWRCRAGRGCGVEWWCGRWRSGGCGCGGGPVGEQLGLQTGAVVRLGRRGRDSCATSSGHAKSVHCPLRGVRRLACPALPAVGRTALLSRIALVVHVDSIHARPVARHPPPVPFPTTIVPHRHAGLVGRLLPGLPGMRPRSLVGRLRHRPGPSWTIKLRGIPATGQ